MRDDIASRVAHLVFVVLLSYLLPLAGEGSLNGVVASLVVEHQLDATNIGFEVVAGILYILTHTKAGLCLGLGEPVFAADVVGLALLSVEG